MEGLLDLVRGCSSGAPVPAPDSAASCTSGLHIPVGPLAGQYDAVLVLSDFEPDDVVALKLLAPRLRGVSMMLVTGEGATDKCSLAGRCLAAYGIDGRATIVQGRKSALEYPSHACTLTAVS